MAELSDLVMIALLCIGTLFCLLAALGIVVMPDVYNRMQTASKGVTLGATSTVLAAAVHFAQGELVVRAVLVCVFLIVTVPVASHLIARAAYRAGDPLAPETTVDELNRQPDPQD